jgi:hypothetical protein
MGSVDHGAAGPGSNVKISIASGSVPVLRTPADAPGWSTALPPGAIM